MTDKFALFNILRCEMKAHCVYLLQACGISGQISRKHSKSALGLHLYSVYKWIRVQLYSGVAVRR